MIEKKLENTPIHYWINDNKAGSAIIFYTPCICKSYLF